MAGSITLYEVVKADGRSTSPFVWRIKLALARKGLSYQSRMVSFTEIPKQFDGRFRTVPIIDFGDSQMNESLAIADRLDEAFPDLPRIFSCPAERAMIAFFDHWLVHEVIISGFLLVYALDTYERLAPQDRDYYRTTREAFWGRTLEEVVANREEQLSTARRSLEPVRRTIVGQPFLGGEEPNFADMCMLGVFIWAGTIGSLPPLAADDPLVGYVHRGLASFGVDVASLGLNPSEPPH